MADLKKQLKMRGLPVTGNKTELVERLQEALQSGKFSFKLCINANGLSGSQCARRNISQSINQTLYNEHL